MSSRLVARQRAVYESYAGRGKSFAEDQTIVSDEPTDMAERIVTTIEEVGADALNLRLQLPGMTPEEVRDQISRIGSTVVGLVNQKWPSPRPASPATTGSGSSHF